MALEGLEDQVLQDRRRRFQACGEGLGALLEHEIVGVLISRQGHHPGFDTAVEKERRAAQGGFGPRLVAVEYEHDAIGELVQQVQMVSGQSRTAGGHRLAESCFVQAHHVQISLYQDHPAGLAQGLPRLGQSEEHPALAVMARLRCVQVLGGIEGADHPAPEPDAGSLRIEDRKDDPIAEHVKRAAGGSLLDQPAGHKIVQGDTLIPGESDQSLPPVEGKAK